MAVVDLPAPRPRHGRGQGADLAPTTLGGHRISLRVFDAGLACCAVEVAAALRRLGADVAEDGFDHAGGADPADGRVPHVLVVAGTITDKLAPLVLSAYQQTPSPRVVLSFGACSNSGGPYWDSYCVTKGVDQIIPVDVYVPGCPPRPEALIDGLRRVLGPAEQGILVGGGQDRAGPASGGAERER